MANNISLPDSWKRERIQGLINIISLTNLKLPQGRYSENGKYPVIDQGQHLIGGYTNEELAVPCELPVIIFGDHTKVIKYINFPFVAGADGIKVIKPSEVFSPKLFYYFLQAIELPNKGYARHFQFLEKEFIPIPPLPEQERIVAKIEELFTQLEAGTASLKRIQAGLKRYKASVLKAACEGRLVAQDSSDEQAEELLRRLGKSPLEGDDLPSLPEGWCWTTVEEIGTTNEQTVLTGPFGSNLGSEDFLNKGVPVLTIGCLTEEGINLEKAKYISEDKAKELDRYTVRAGDVLFSRMATVGRAGLVTQKHNRVIFNYHLMRLRLASEVIHADYFISYVRGASIVKDYVRDVNHGATRDGINTEQLLSMPVALPPFAEQQRIVAEVERRLSVAAEVEAVVRVAIWRSVRLRQAILKRAFEGKLVAQNPEDEPAEALLESVRADSQTKVK